MQVNLVTFSLVSGFYDMLGKAFPMLGLQKSPIFISNAVMASFLFCFVFIICIALSGIHLGMQSEVGIPRFSPDGTQPSQDQL